jgi:hypothetical protein
MEDLGDTQYLGLLKTGRGVDKLYGDALDHTRQHPGARPQRPRSCSSPTTARRWRASST